MAGLGIELLFDRVADLLQQQRLQQAWGANADEQRPIHINRAFGIGGVGAVHARRIHHHQLKPKPVACQEPQPQAFGRRRKSLGAQPHRAVGRRQQLTEGRRFGGPLLQQQPGFVPSLLQRVHLAARI